MSQLETMRGLLWKCVDIVVDGIHVDNVKPLSATERANLHAAYMAIGKCLAETETPETLIELTRMLIHNGVAGAYADQYERYAEAQ
jgi:hypothetical protein